MTKEIQPWASDEGADLFPHEVQSCSAIVVASVARTHTHTHTHARARTPSGKWGNPSLISCVVSCFQLVLVSITLSFSIFP